MGRTEQGGQRLRYDACIIGAGAEGLAAAAVLALDGRRVMVVERGLRPGGRCETCQFHPGFFASLFADELPAIPPAIFRDLDLGRRGVLLLPPEASPPDTLAGVRAAVIARVMADAADAPRRAWFRRSRLPLPFPGEELVAAGCVARLQGVPGGMVRGGLGMLAAGLTAAAEQSGAAFRLNQEATGIRRRGGRIAAVELAGGGEVEARAVISTLDVKRTFLSLFAWNDLPKPLVERVASFRAAPGIARLLLALETPPAVKDPLLLRRPIAVAADADEALRAWSGGLIVKRPPAVLRLVSAVDPFLAPDGGAVLTVTLAAIPHMPFDGAWDEAKCARLRDQALALVEEALPGTMAKVKAAELILPTDIESRLGLSEGDLSGGALIAGQMLSFRPFVEDCVGTRTPIAGLYLAGPSSALGPLATCASGVAAARAVLADLGAGRL